MPINPRVQQLLDQLMDTDSTPEEVCQSCPELLLEVRAQYEQVCRVRTELLAMFPPELASRANLPTPNERSILPAIPGYEVMEILGQGGAGVVFRARDLRLGRQVAIKMLIAGSYAGSAELLRFQREAEAVASLCHPNVVQIYEVGDHEGRPYFSMEFVDGGSLAQRLAGAPQPARETAALLATLSDAINAAHQGGMIHRDLKPANILLTSDGRPKITDFGLARRLEGDRRLTLSGVPIGTPSYMAPEQARGQSNAIATTTDVYALGAILYELLTGRPPFRAETSAETIHQVIFQDPVRPSLLNPSIPRDLETISLKCLEKDPRRRYSTAGALADDLARYVHFEPIQARPAGRLERTLRWIQRHRSISASLAVMVLLLTTIVVGSTLSAMYFRSLQLEQRELTIKADKLSIEKEAQRARAVEFQRRETGLRQRAEAQSRVLRQSFYFGQMNLAGQSIVLPSGLAHLGERLGDWEYGQPDLRGWEWYYLNGLCHRDLMTLRGHPDSVFHAAWSPDGRSIASAGAIESCAIWDVTGKREPRWLRGHSGIVFSVAWSPDGERVATAADDGTIRVWKANDGHPLLTLRGHETPVFSVAWNRDGTRLVSGGEDKTVRIWSLTADTRPDILNGHEAEVTGVAWSPDGKSIASASGDTSVRIWDADSKQQLKELLGHSNVVNRVAWRPDGERLASASNDQTVIVWDPSDGAAVRTLRWHGISVHDVTWSPDGLQLASGGDDETVKVGAAFSDDEPITIRGHTSGVTTVGWSPDGTQLLSASHDGTVKVWDSRSKPEAIVLTGHEGCVTTLSWGHREQSRLASGDSAGVVHIWNSTESETPMKLIGHDGPLNCVTWSPDGTRLATTGFDQTIRIWDSRSGKELKKFVGHTAQVMSVQWSPNGLRLASAGEDQTVRIWNVTTGECERTHLEDDQIVFSLGWSPDSRRIVSASDNGTIRVWDPDSGLNTFIYRGHSSMVRSVSWSPDGRFVASGAYDDTARILDANTGKKIHILRGHSGSVFSVAWNPEGTRLATASQDRTVKVWDVATGSETLTFNHLDHVFAVAWSDDGLALASAGEDQKILIHDATHGYLAARTPAALPLVNRRLSSGTIHSADLKLRAEIHGNRGEWDQAAADVRKYFELETDQRWLVLHGWIAGPYSAELRTSFPLEELSDPGESIPDDLTGKLAPVWQRLPYGHRGFVDLGDMTDDNAQVSTFVMFKVFSSSKQSVAIILNSVHDSRLWINGNQIEKHSTKGVSTDNEQVFPAVLQSGWNTLLAQVVNLTDQNSFNVRISDFPAEEAGQFRTN